MVNSSGNVSHPIVIRYFAESFERGVRGAVEIGGLLAPRWHIGKAESNETAKLLPEMYGAAKAIEKRWTSLEEEHGEGALIMEVSGTIQRCIANNNPASRHFQNPSLIENARRLRRTKGQDWWIFEHHYDSLAEAVLSRRGTTERAPAEIT